MGLSLISIMSKHKFLATIHDPGFCPGLRVGTPVLCTAEFSELHEVRVGCVCVNLIIPKSWIEWNVVFILLREECALEKQSALA